MTRFCITMLLFSLFVSSSFAQDVFVEFEYQIVRPNGNLANFALDSGGDVHYRLYNPDSFYLVLYATHIHPSRFPVVRIEAPLPPYIDLSSIIYPDGWEGLGTTISSGNPGNWLRGGEMFVYAAEIDTTMGTLIDNAELGEGLHRAIALLPTPLIGQTAQPVFSQLVRNDDFVLSDSWQNDELIVDVNADGCVSPIDALLVINELSAPRDEFRRAPAQQPDQFLDVTNDGFISPLDALFVLNNFGIGCD